MGFSTVPGRVGHGLRTAGGGLRRAVRGKGEESGLPALLEVATLNAAGDAMVAVALANTVFFSVPLGEARTKVALYLLITMAPFAILAPAIGPALDHFRHGRRVALASTLVARAALTWVLPGNLHSLTLYPLALLILVASRAFGVSRSAVVPRVLPRGGTLVGANSRLSLTGVVAGAVAVPLGVGVSSLLGYAWLLRLTAVVFLVGAIRAMAMPAHVDDASGEQPARGLQRAALGGARRWRRALGDLPAALRSAAALRAVVGFLTIFLAFLLRTDHGRGSPHGTGSVVALAAMGSLGSGIGLALGGRLRQRRPEALLVGALLVATAACVAGAAVYGFVVSLVAFLLTTSCASLAKLSLDAVIQRDVPEGVRASAFARSETLLQLSWVVGGAMGLSPVSGVIGFAVAGAGGAAALLLELNAVRQARRDRTRAGAAAPAAPPGAPAARAAPGDVSSAPGPG